MASDRNRHSFTSENSEKGLRWFHLRLSDLGSCTRHGPVRAPPPWWPELEQAPDSDLSSQEKVRRHDPLGNARPQEAVPMFFQKTLSATFLVVQWLRLCFQCKRHGLRSPCAIKPFTPSQKKKKCVCVHMYEKKKTLSTQPL